MSPTLFGLSGDELKSAITIAYTIIWCVIALIGLIITYKFFKAVFRLSGKAGAVFGDSLSSKLISLGVASLFFPYVLPDIFMALLSLLGKLVDGIATTFYLPTEELRNFDVSRASESISRTVATLIRGWTTLFSNALAALRQIPIREAVLMIAVGALCGLLLRPSEERHPAGADRRPELWLVHFFRTMSPRTRQNLAFFLILAIAGYLSIAAIAAIPALRESTAASAEISADKLKERLESLRKGSDASFVQPVYATNPFDKLTKIAEATATASPAPDGTSSKKLSQEEVEALKKFSKTASELRAKQLTTHTKLVGDLKAQRDEGLESALEYYRINSLERKGRREAARYFLDMVDWYGRKLSSMESQINGSAEEIRNLDWWFRDTADRVAGYFTNDYPTEFRVQSISNETIQLFTFDSNRVAFRSAQPEERIPDRPELGSYLGPFALVARWLLRTESLALALIVGMIGFGLLGSACSSFVREKSARADSNQPLVRDLSGVIIRGCSAAIVVFLAAQGGLAIFGSANTEPNPYVLLLTCLVAAVFSDSVWERTQQWFKSLGESKGQGQAASIAGRHPKSKIKKGNPI
jgi:hypothetical protein